MPDTIDKLVIGTSAASGVATAVGGGLTAAGFSSSGVVAGSIAATTQAGIGNVVAGSTFAGIQSLGATGILATVGTIGGVGLFIGAGYGGYKLYKHIKKTPAPKI